MEGVSVSFYVAMTEATWKDRVHPSFQFNEQFIVMGWKWRQQELETAGHKGPTFREHRGMNANMLPSSPSPVLHFREMVPPMMGGSSYLINILKTAPYKSAKGTSFSRVFLEVKLSPMPHRDGNQHSK